MNRLVDFYLGTILLFLGINIISCAERSENEIIPKSKDFKVISLDPKKEIEFSDFGKDLEYVVLESRPDFFIAAIDKIKINETRILILSKLQKSIFIFDKSGKIISKISDFGDGPGKYSGISDFGFMDNFLYLLTSPSRFVFKYDLSGKLLQIIPTNNNYMYELSPVNSGWISHLRDAFDSENNFNIVKWDSSFSIRENQFLFIESERRNNSLVVDSYMSGNGENLFMTQNFSNQVYKFKGDSLELSFEILIDGRGVDNDFMEKFISSPNRAMSLAVEENSFTGFKKILSTDDVLFLESLKGSGTVSSFISIPSAKSISYIGLNFKFEFGIAGKIIGSDNEKFVMHISEKILNDLKDLDLKGQINDKSLKNETIRDVIRFYEKESNPVLLFFGVDFSKL
ncbi:6-bladed beta-propeller [Algoriphagus sp.]|uniref:6-bladed beta-propeller n=1 Tax=Algoriphagus sp. TaxID=1872435 RepID=UPI00391B29D8